jgi:hypothetical protein
MDIERHFAAAFPQQPGRRLFACCGGWRGAAFKILHEAAIGILRLEVENKYGGGRFMGGGTRIKITIVVLSFVAGFFIMLR